MFRWHRKQTTVIVASGGDEAKERLFRRHRNEGSGAIAFHSVRALWGSVLCECLCELLLHLSACLPADIARVPGIFVYVLSHFRCRRFCKTNGVRSSQHKTRVLSLSIFISFSPMSPFSHYRTLCVQWDWFFAELSMK